MENLRRETTESCEDLKQQTAKQKKQLPKPCASCLKLEKENLVLKSDLANAKAALTLTHAERGSQVEQNRILKAQYSSAQSELM